MNTDMNLQKVPVKKLKPAKYNPRKDLKPGDPAYEKIKRSMTTYGYIDPVIWNEVTGNIVGGHQRYKVLVAEGVKEIDCVGCIPPTRNLRCRAASTELIPGERKNMKLSPIRCANPSSRARLRRRKPMPSATNLPTNF